jgi:CheY-like chemotaxis protein
LEHQVKTVTPRILCVEDNQEIRDYLQLLLVQTGYAVVAAGTMVEGLRQAKTQRFDLYLLDNNLPDGSGLDLCRLIRTFDPQTPIIFYSSFSASTMQEAALAAGAQSYISKKEPPEILEQVIATLLKKKEARLAQEDPAGEAGDEVPAQQEFDRLVRRYNSDFRFLMLRAGTGQYECLLTSFLVLKDLYGTIMKLHEVMNFELRVIPYPITLRSPEILLSDLGVRQHEMEMINNFLNSIRATQGREFEELLEEGLPILCGSRPLHQTV